VLMSVNAPQRFRISSAPAPLVVPRPTPETIRRATRIALIAATIIPELFFFSRPAVSRLIPGAIGWWVRLVQDYRIVASLIATIPIAAAIFGWNSIRQLVSEQIRADDERVRIKFFALHLAAVAGFVLWVQSIMLSGRLETPDGERWFLIGAALFLLALGSWVQALFPARAWMRWITCNPRVFFGAIATSAFVQIFRLEAIRIAQPLIFGTLWCVEGMLLILGQSTVFHPERAMVGTHSYAVQVMPSCAGVEGIGVTTAFVAAYLFFSRRELRFPAALMLLPAAAISIWLLNVVRITSLIFIGGWSPQIAMRGFHTVAGWLMCTVATCAMVVASRRMRALGAEESEPQPITGPNPAAMYLLPILTILIVAMLSRITATSFDFLYPIRVAAVGAVLWFYRRELREFSGRISLFSVLIGAVVFAAWLVLQRNPGTAAENSAFAAGLSAMSPAIAGLWLFFRVIGAVVTVPIAEELAFRGYLLRKLVGADFQHVDFRQFTWLSLIVSSILFGMMHQEWIAGVIAGILFAFAVYRRGALMDAIVAHSTANALLACYVLVTHRWWLWN
jgi:exosortase E/protease (VPEID-CTERM system)